MNTVLVVDDKEMLRDSVGATLQRAGFGIVTADGGQAALEIIARRRPDCVVTDLRMPGMSGMDLLEQVRQIDDALPVVVMTAYGAVDTAVQAVKLGAFDYITKPFEGDELIVAVKRAIEHTRLLRENAVLKTAVDPERAHVSSFTTESQGGSGWSGVAGSGGQRGLDRIVGDSPAIRRVKQQVMAVAESAGTVLICGESGVGKEVIARAIHDLSPRQCEPFLAVNCAALSESLLESELFGHERGSFTGAEKLRKGRFELADRGSLVLDEISEISPRVQAKLLRVLQERAFERVGSSVTIGVDVRVVATSNRDLPRAVARGDFRQDLFFRLNVLPIHLPPLRDRLDDIPVLVEHFVKLTSTREGKSPKRFTHEALELLQSYTWPGNVRELQNIVERAVVLSRGETVERSLLEPWVLNTPSSEDYVHAGSAAASPSHAQPQAHAHGIASRMMVASPSNGHPAHHHPSNGSGNGHTANHAHATNSVVESKFAVAAQSASNDFGSDAISISGRQLEDIERDCIVRTLNKYNGHRQRTAVALGIGVRTLGLKLKKWKQLQLVDAGL
ncbi:MAG: sigma-54 dependent transcriptional regulator [Phycisphaerales bacterium]|nr:sigma-54 dependent transcriptional regulator [Phycisphaerales bacterium]